MIRGVASCIMIGADGANGMVIRKDEHDVGLLGAGCADAYNQKQEKVGCGVQW